MEIGKVPTPLFHSESVSRPQTQPKTPRDTTQVSADAGRANCRRERDVLLRSSRSPISASVVPFHAEFKYFGLNQNLRQKLSCVEQTDNCPEPRGYASEQRSSRPPSLTTLLCITASRSVLGGCFLPVWLRPSTAHFRFRTIPPERVIALGKFRKAPAIHTEIARVFGERVLDIHSQLTGD